MVDVATSSGRIRRSIRKWLPEPYLRRRARLHRERVRRLVGVPQTAQRFVELHGSVVLRGPFAGLEYPPWLLRQIDAPVAKLLGAYETELEPAINPQLQAQPSIFVDIGAAEGYYAVGFAVKSPRTEVHAFETERSSRKRLETLALRNGVADRVVVHGACKSESLLDVRLSGAFVLSDCEGAEVEIFTDDVARHLAGSTLLVELHDEAANTDVLSVFESRFSEFHEVMVVHGSARNPDQFPEMSGLTKDERRVALDELRGEPARWALLTPRHTHRPADESKVHSETLT
jgi:hypothetical protein